MREPMNRSGVILLGVVATILFSMAGLVIVPNLQLRTLPPVTAADVDGTMKTVPHQPDSIESAGRETYVSQGCIYCHSQQIRPKNFGADEARGWATRRSVPRDYANQNPPLLGTMRTGPDLSNIAQRQPDATWHHLHLFDARLVSPGSIMPPFGSLYDVHDSPVEGGIRLPDDYLGKPGWIVPKREARQLVSYLLSLKQELPLEAVE